MFARGTVLIVSVGGGLSGKPRPTVVIQAAQFDFPETVIVVPLTSTDQQDNSALPVLLPDSANGLLEPSALMTHRITAARKSDVGNAIGTMSPDDMARIDAALSLVLGLNAG